MILDGLDCCKYYWHGLRKEKGIFAKHQLSGGSIMTRGRFLFNGVRSLAFITEKSCYDHILPVVKILTREKWISQKDTAPMHKNRDTNLKQEIY